MGKSSTRQSQAQGKSWSRLRGTFSGSALLACAALAQQGRGVELADPSAEHGRAIGDLTELRADPAADLRVPLVVAVQSTWSRRTFVKDVLVEVAITTIDDPLGGTLLASGTTEADGRAHFRLPWSPILDALLAPASTRLFVRVHEAGWQRAYRSTFLPLAEEPLELLVVAARGVTLRGRVLDAEGRSTPATVTALDLVSAASPSASSTTEARADGHFDLQLPHGGMFDIRAESRDGRRGSLLDCVVDDRDPPQSVEVHLRGDGHLRGIVRDDMGVPEAGMHLLVLASELDTDSDRVDPAILERAPIGKGRMGASFAECTTDIDGTFDVRGLQPGAYSVRQGWMDRQVFPVRITHEPVLTDRDPVELVATRAHLVVRVLAAGGAVVIGALTPKVPSVNPYEDTWPESAAVDVFDPRSENSDAVIGQVRLPTGEWVAEVVPGRAYCIELSGGYLAWSVQRVEVPSASHRIVVDLLLVTSEIHELRVTVEDAAGAPVEGPVSLVLEDVATGFPLWLERESWPANGVFTLNAPSGTWRLVAEGSSFIDRMHGQLIRARSHGRFERMLNIAGDTSVTALLPAGARLHVELVGTANDADREDVQARLGNDPEATAEQLAVWARSAQLVLTRTLRRPIHVEFGARTKESLATLRRYAELGESITSELLPSGQFTLEARLPGGRVVERSVVLVDGRTTDVTIEF